MRILHVISSLDPRAGGPPMVISRLAAAQAGIGHHVHILYYAVASENGKDPNPDIDAKLGLIPHWSKLHQHRLAPADRKEWYLNSRAKVELTTIVPQMDIVHVHGVWDPILASAAQVSRTAKVPYVVAPHGMLDPWALSVKPLKKKIALALRYGKMVHSAAMMQALSRYESECIAKFGFSGKIATIPNGVFLEEIDPLPARGAFADHFPAIRGRRFITFLSRLHPVKGLDLLVDAFATLAHKHSDVDLVIVGPDYGVEAALKAQIASKGLTSRVHLIGPMWGRERFKPVVDGACFCLPSEHEAFSVAICEAMACGAPVVITHNCNLPEAQDAKAGLVIDRTVPALAAALDQVLSDPAEAQKMGQRARELVLERFTWPVVAAASVTHYSEIQGRR